MRVMHAMVKTMEVPVERLRFDPDPLGLTVEGEGRAEREEGSECDCPTCRIARCLAQLKAGAVSPEIHVQLTAQPSLPSLPSFQISAFDVHGSPERQADQRQRTSELAAEIEAQERRLPVLLVWAVRLFVYVTWHGYVGLRRLRSFVLGRPRLRVVPREGQ